MKRNGYADLPLHHGHVPPWLAERMARLGGAIVEAILVEYGKSEVLRRLGDPFWFQALGCVLGMDWHSSGITTSVMGALKKAVNPHAKQFGLYICGGRGKHSRKTPVELLEIADKTGIDGKHLVKCSKLSAKIDNTAIQDGYQLYLHSFIVSNEGEWAVVQQGMNDMNGYARRYHWHSPSIQSFIEEPHSGISGINQGLILNFVDKEAEPTRAGVVDIAKEEPNKILPEIRKIIMPGHHDVKPKDINLKRLGSTLALAWEKNIKDFESLLLLQGVGPRTMQSLALVSEVIYGTPSRFSDPARFSFAHGGKDGHPFPVPTKVYDETIDILKNAVEKAKIGHTDKQKAIKSLGKVVESIEKDFIPNANFNKVVKKERQDSYKYGGRTVFGKSKPPNQPKKGRDGQMELF
ncbi:DUF763 domain-containing protein [Fulvivirgaceae bacterium BMA10]|uniref:DUF763 domain-containing protein n=1 Tax=Splendidivirga corallicola TaxID=3051826 RepID=A0ABT8KJM3_9BACT|nr:DUF763 domain-containing protein [Fulvivirgaceae bacterium BMA10]